MSNNKCQYTSVTIQNSFLVLFISEGSNDVGSSMFECSKPKIGGIGIQVRLPKDELIWKKKKKTTESRKSTFSIKQKKV